MSASPLRHVPSVTVALIALATAGWFLAKESPSRPTDFGKQIGTVGAIRGVAVAIDSYRADHKVNPASLDALVPDYILKQSALVDAWGRRLQYYASEDHYALMSYGRNGSLEGQLVTAGGFGPANDFDQDIVLIDDQWAQSPPNVDR